MTGYKLRQVKHETGMNGDEIFFLHYHRGRDEATVTVTKTVKGVTAECEELPADSRMDEMVLEELAEEFVNEYGTAFGDVGTL